MNIADKIGRISARRQIRVTLRAVRVARGRKSDRSSMIRMAGSACGHECLSGVMQGAVMAGEALLVDDLYVVKTQAGHMTGGALLRENGVRC